MCPTSSLCQHPPERTPRGSVPPAPLTQVDGAPSTVTFRAITSSPSWQSHKVRGQGHPPRPPGPGETPEAPASEGTCEVPRPVRWEAHRGRSAAVSTATSVTEDIRRGQHV